MLLLHTNDATHNYIIIYHIYDFIYSKMSLKYNFFFLTQFNREEKFSPHYIAYKILQGIFLNNNAVKTNSY